MARPRRIAQIGIRHICEAAPCHGPTSDLVQVPWMGGPLCEMRKAKPISSLPKSPEERENCLGCGVSMKQAIAFPILSSWGDTVPWLLASWRTSLSSPSLSVTSSPAHSELPSAESGPWMHPSVAWYDFSGIPSGLLHFIF